MNYRNLLLLTLTLVTTQAAAQSWVYYLAPCRHTNDGKLECLAVQKNNRLELIKNSFAGPAITPGTANQIDFDAIRASAHNEMKKLGFTTAQYIYTVGHGDPNTHTVYHAFLIDPTKTITLTDPQDEKLVWTELGIAGLTAGLGKEFVDHVTTGALNRYQRKTIYADYNQADKLLPVQPFPAITYEKTLYDLAKPSTEPYVLATVAIMPTGSDTAQKPEDDTAFERYDFILPRVPTVETALYTGTKKPAYWDSSLKDISKNAEKFTGERAINLLSQIFYGLAKRESN